MATAEQLKTDGPLADLRVIEMSVVIPSRRNGVQLTACRLVPARSYPGRMLNCWLELLKDGMIEVEYGVLVADHEGQTRILLDKLSLDFEQTCLDFDQNKTHTATASSVQVR